MQLQSDHSLLCEHPAPVLQPLAGKSVRGLVHYGSVFRSGGGQQLEPPRVAPGFEGMLHRGLRDSFHGRHASALLLSVSEDSGECPPATMKLRIPQQAE